MASVKSSPSELPPVSRRRQSHAELRELQRLAASAIMRPLGRGNRMQTTWTDGRPTRQVMGEFIKPNDRLTSLERIELYNRQYWFRLVDGLYDDFPGVRAVVGEAKFSKLVRAYIECYPSRSYTMRNLGRHMGKFIGEQPHFAGSRLELAIEMAQFEWAQVEAFDGR